MNKQSIKAKKSLSVMDDNCQSDKGDFLSCTSPPDPELVAQGWERRFIADARMTRDALETYSELGYEVRLEPIDVEGLKDECTGCKVLLEKFSVVYTRKKNTE